MKKYLLLTLITFLSFNMVSQMALVPGQPSQGLHHQRSVKAKDNIGFAFYYSQGNESQVTVIENGIAEEIVWANTPSNFNPYYRGNLGDKYYFFSIFGNDGLLYEYDHISKNTRTIPFPQDYSCSRTLLLTDNMNGKIYFSCGLSSSEEKAVMSFDGSNFVAFDSPPNHIIMMEEFLYSDELNKILIWYYEVGNHNNGAQLYTFDGINLTHVPNPASNFLSGRYGIPFENDILLPYVNAANAIDLIFSLYKYDGSNLVEIPGLPNTTFQSMRIMEGQNKVYIALDNYTNLSSSLYEYDGNEITEIYNSSFFNPHFISEFDGKDMFSLANTTLNSTNLYAYDGSTFQEITGAESSQPISFGGILNNKLYLGYYNVSSDANVLYSYNPGTSEVQLVPSVPSNMNYGYYGLKYNNYLLQTFRANNENSLFAQNQNNEFLNLDPENKTLGDFEFQLGDKIYYSYSDIDWISNMYMWDGNLNTPDFNLAQNDIIIFPNPFTNDISIEIPNALSSENIEISVFSVDGKMVKKQNLENKSSQIQLSLETLISGIYILEVKGETTVIRKKIVKK